MLQAICLLGGATAMAYALWIAHLRKRAPERLRQLAPLSHKFGPKKGVLLHGLIFTSLPLGAGMWLFFEGARLLG